MRAFTMIEVLIVIALMASLAGASAIAGNESYQRALASGDTDRIVSLLYRARAMSLANVCSSPCDESQRHGVRVDQNTVVLLENEQIIESHPLSTALSPTSSPVSFSPRTGASNDGIIKVRNEYGREWVISVSESGVISVD